MRYFELIDNLMNFYVEGEFSSEGVQAKAEFYDLAGIFDEQSNNFDMKMAQFTDWYIFTRKLNKFALTPIEHLMQKRPLRVSDSDLVYYRNLSNHRQSLFEFIKIKGSDLYVKDLFSDYKVVIKNSPVTYGFVKEEYFQARLIPHEDSFIFTASFCFHPPDATKFVLNEVKRIKKLPEESQKEAREQALLRFFKMRNKFEQYQHVGIQEIYTNESRLRV